MPPVWHQVAHVSDELGESSFAWELVFVLLETVFALKLFVLETGVESSTYL